MKGVAERINEREDRALGCESSKEEVKEIAEAVDPEDEGFVAWERFLEVAALKMKCGCSFGGKERER